MVHPEGHLAGVVVTANAVHIAEVGVVYADQESVFVVVAIRQLMCSVTIARELVLGHLAVDRWIDGIADFLCTGNHRCTCELFLQSSFPHEVFHYKFFYQTPANIAMTDI